MKYLFVLSLLLVFQNSSALNAKEIEQFLEDLRLRMCHPIEKLGLPALDPMTKKNLEEFNVNIKDFLMIDGWTRRFELLGLSDFIIQDIKFPGLLKKSLVIDLLFPNTTFFSDYKANGTAGYVFPIDGRGDLQGYVTDFHFRVEGKVKVGLKGISMSDFKLIFGVKEIYLSAERFVPDERINDFLHAVVNELGLELVQYIWNETHETLTKLSKKINQYLKDKPLSEIIGGGSGEPIFGEDAPPPDCKPDWNPEK
uniref:Uncharacterized protein n=1 Tax=Megaselia scalaris TaxID=36166 RepID=T1GZI4_MEGSC